jgi:hypothetical protein
MPDDKPPTQPEGENGDFTFEIDKQGNLLIDGVMTDRQINPLRMETPEELPVPEDAPADDSPPADTPPEVEAKGETPPPKEEVSRETLGKQKFKLKVYGEELEKEFDQNELVATLQKGLASEKRFQEVAAKEREIEPFQHIVKSSQFKDWLDSQIQSGQIEAPAPPPKPEPEDIMGYRLRAKESDFGNIRTAMAEWAVTLPDYEARQLESNHRVFNMAYDRFKAAQGQIQPAPPAPNKVVAKEVAEAVLATKEQRKDSARAVTSGTHVDTDPNKAKQQRIAQLQKQSRSGNLGASVELARLLFSDELTGL